MRDLHLSGYMSVAIASVLFGVAGAFAKVLFHQEIQPLDLTILRAILASLVIGLIALLRQVSLAINLEDARFLFIQGLLLSAVNYTFYLAISATGVAVAIMLEYTAPIFVVLINLLLGNARFGHTTAAVLLLGTCGCFLLVGAYDVAFVRANLPGVLAGFACGLSFALYSLWGNRGHLRKLNAWTMTFYSFVMSALLWLPFMPLMRLRPGDLTLELTTYLFFIGALATALPYWLYLMGLATVPAFHATIIGMLDPAAAALAAFVLLGERLAPLQLVGIGLIFTAILYLQRQSPRASSA